MTGTPSLRARHFSAATRLVPVTRTRSPTASSSAISTPSARPAGSARAPAEIPLLLPAWEAAALDAEARRRGLSAGRLLRLLVCECLERAGEAGRSG